MHVVRTARPGQQASQPASQPASQSARPTSGQPGQPASQGLGVACQGLEIACQEPATASKASGAKLKGPGIAWQGLEIAWQGPAAASRAAGTELKVCNCRKKQAQEAIATDRRRRRLGHLLEGVWASQPASQARPARPASGQPASQASQRLGIARHGLEIMWREPTAANRATGTELKVCNCHRKQAQEAMTTDRRRRRQGRWHRPQTVHHS